jgi:hypothetical protein
MNTLAELRAEALKLMDEHPTHKSGIVDLYNSAITKIMNDGDEPNECTIILTTMLQLVSE